MRFKLRDYESCRILVETNETSAELRSEQKVFSSGTMAYLDPNFIDFKILEQLNFDNNDNDKAWQEFMLETVTGEFIEENELKYSVKRDIFSFGMILLEMCENCHPLIDRDCSGENKFYSKKQLKEFYRNSHNKLAENFKNRDHYSPELGEIIDSCLDPNLNSRTTWEQLYQNHYGYYYMLYRRGPLNQAANKFLNDYFYYKLECKYEE